MTEQRRREISGPPRAEDLLAVVRLGRPHGVKGEVTGVALTPEVLDLETLLTGREAWVRREGEAGRKIQVRGLRPHREGYLLSLIGFEDRDAAESMRGAELCLERNELPELPEGWYWEADLIDLEVIDARLGSIGRVSGLEALGGQWSLKAARPSGESIMIPWVADIVRGVDFEKGRVAVDLPADYPGLAPSDSE